MNECRCQGVLALPQTTLLECELYAGVPNGTGIAARTLILRPNGKDASVVFDQVTSTPEDDALPGNAPGPRLELEVADGAVAVWSERRGCSVRRFEGKRRL